MGNGTWTFGGSWTNNSTSANWSAGTGNVVFNSTTSQTLTFAGFAGAEFYDVTLQSTAGSGSGAFTMAADGLRWGNVLAVQDKAGGPHAPCTPDIFPPAR